MKEEEVRTLVEAIEDPAADPEKDKKPREPPIVFKELIAQDEYSRLKSSLGTAVAGSPEDEQALNELNEYAVKNEGAWALSDETIHYIGEIILKISFLCPLVEYPIGSFRLLSCQYRHGSFSQYCLRRMERMR